MTEEVAATPGWVEERLERLFAGLPQTAPIREALNSYTDCLASRKAPSAPSDMLGAEFGPCRPALSSALQAAGMTADQLAPLMAKLEALEAEIAAGS